MYDVYVTTVSSLIICVLKSFTTLFEVYQQFKKKPFHFSPIFLVEVSPFLQTTKALKNSRVITLLCLDLGTKKGVRGQFHAPAALPPGKDPVPIVQETG
jgi:hypothetical protein